jgi:hypothetical protein
MSDHSNATAAAADPSTEALASAMPEIRSVKTKGWLLLALSVLVTVLLAFWASGIEDEAFKWVIFILVIGLFVVLGIIGWVRGKHERTVMPIIAQTFGLHYQKSPTGFYDTLPRNFIPLGGRRSVDDMMEGRIADRSFRFAECKTETGGKNSSTLFKGIVLDVQSAGTLPSFIIASEKETKGFLFFKGRVQVDDMMLVHQSTGHDGQAYGLWSHSEEPARMAGMRAFMDSIISLGPQVLGSSSLYSLVSTGGYYHVALRHSRDMFQIGGLFSDDQQVMSDIRSAASEFAHPVQLASEILKAEQVLLAAR